VRRATDRFISWIN